LSLVSLATPGEVMTSAATTFAQVVPQSTATARISETAGRNFTTAALAGTFAFKFTGYAVKDRIPYRLTGLGQFQIDDKGNLTGMQRSAITALQGLDAELRTSVYQLSGTISIANDGTGTASIRFTAITPNRLNLQGEFFVLLPGSVDRIWMISSGSVIPEGKEPADELVNLEAIRM
jgi:hypothetical protein